MPPRPFPYQLGIGTDIVHRIRLKKLLLKPDPEDRERKLGLFTRRFLTWREQGDFTKRFTNADEIFRRDLDQVTGYLAGRWAAKEATIKAVSWRRLSFMEIQILRHPAMNDVSGKVYALILDKPASAHRHNDKPAFISLDLSSDGTSRDGSINPKAESTEGGEALLDHQAETHKEFTPGFLQNDNLSGQIAKISISHDGEYVTAVCLAAEEPRTGDVGGEAAAREP